MDTKCTAYNDWLAETVDAALPLPLSLAEHLQGCPACAAQAAAEATLSRAIGEWRAHPPLPTQSSLALAQAVLAALPVPVTARVAVAPRSSRGLIALLVAAAATLAAVMVARGPAPAPIAPVVSLPVTDSVEQLLRGMESAPPVVLAVAPVSTPTLAAWPSVDVVTRSHLPDTTQTPTETANGTNDWNRLAAPLSRAFRFLGDALPATDAG